MEEKRQGCLMTLQIHRSETPSIDVVIDRFASTAARRLNFAIWTIEHRHMYRKSYFVSAHGSQETRVMGLSDGRKRFRIGLAVLIQYRSVTASHPPSQPRSRSYYAQR